MTHSARFEFLVSLMVLGIVIVFALVGLALDGNFPKALRVGAASLTYGAVLVVLLARAGWLRAPSARPPWWSFAVAGAFAGLVSGLVRPQIEVRLVAVGALTGGLLLSGIHWLGLLALLRVRQRTARAHQILS